MNSIALLPIFLVGLLGGVHCVGMCGGIVHALCSGSDGASHTSRLRNLIAYNTGRIASYAVAGALAGGVLIGMTEALAGLLFTPSAKSMFAFAILVLVLLFRPQGLFSVAQTRRV